MLEQRPLSADAAYAARFGRRHLAYEGLIERLVTVRHALDVKERFVAGRSHVAGIFAEWAFWLERVGWNFPLQHDLGGGRHFEWHSLTRNHVHGFTAQRAGNGEFIERIRHLRYRHVADRWIGANNHGQWRGVVYRVIFINLPRPVLGFAD